MQPVTGGFTKGFLWGASTSGHQVEGGSNDQWSAYEFEKNYQLADDADENKDYGNGRGVPPEIWPMIKRQAKDPGNYLSLGACEHYQRFEDDLDLAKQLGLKAYRFSIEWSRIEPVSGLIEPDEIEHYRRVIRACKARGIEPVVCLWHWCHPLWFEQEGAWLGDNAARRFEEYVRTTVQALAGEGVTYWLVLNEPEVYSLLSYGPKFAIGTPPWPPQNGSYRNFRKVSRNLVECHRRSYEIIHELVPGAVVSSAVNLSCNDSARDPISKGIKAFVDHSMWAFHRATSDRQDFVGLNYYMHQVYKLSQPFAGQKPDAWRSDLGWELYPEGLYRVLIQLRNHKATRGKPVIITEHGLADFRDVHRERYLRESLQWCLKAIQDGVDLRGYFHWSLLDNFEWDKGFWPEFGLIHVDRNSLERTIRPSAWSYARIIANNAI